MCDLCVRLIPLEYGRYTGIHIQRLIMNKHVLVSLEATHFLLA